MLQILKLHAEDIGFKNPITIYDGTDQIGLIKNIIEDEFSMDGKYARALRAHIGRAKNFPRSDAYIHSVKEFRKLDPIFEHYNHRLKESNAMNWESHTNWSAGFPFLRGGRSRTLQAILLVP